jgi:hypothetical protein
MRDKNPMEQELDEIFMHFLPNGMSKKEAKERILAIYKDVCDEASAIYGDLVRTDS